MRVGNVHESQTGVDVTKVPTEGQTHQRKPSLAKLLKYGANPNAFSLEDMGQRRTLLCLAIEEAEKIFNFDKIDLLLEAKADPNLKSETGDWPLMLATKHEDIELARKLLHLKADPNLQDEKQVSALHVATHQNDAHMVQLLLMHGALVNSVDRMGQTPLFFGQSRDILHSLLEADADVLHLNKKSQCALHLTSSSGYFDAVTYLVDRTQMGDMVNLRDEHGRTPLHHAAFRGHVDVMSRLMDVGADPKVKTKKGQTAMTLADEQGHTDAAYYVYNRVSGGNSVSWREALHNPVFLTVAAVMGVTSLMNRKVLWELSLDMLGLLFKR